MARVVKLVWDISGTEADEDKFVKCVVRSHPATDEAKTLDMPGELDSLKSAGNLVVLEVGSSGDKKKVVVSHADFKKLVGDDAIKKAPGTHGRRAGWSPKAKS